MCETNPVRKGRDGVKRNHETKRRRYVHGDELGRLMTALAAHPNREEADVIRLLLLTGSRRGEVLSMRWGDISDEGTWSKPAATLKQGEDHITPLSGPARQLLSEIRTRQKKASPHKPLPTFVFAGAGGKAHIGTIERAWRRICRVADITGLRVHDLRHSFASQLVSSGHSLELIASLLGHASPRTTARYAHLFDDVQRQAVDRVAAAIEAAAGGGNQEAEVVPLPRRR